MTDQNEYNRRLIAEFRANGGKVGGPLADRLLLLLTSTGARSGQQRTTPLGYIADGDRWLVFASQLGAPTSPAWYHNLLAHPQVTIEVGPKTFDVTAVVTTGEERQRLWARAAELYPFLADHQAKTTRQIPVVALVPRQAATN
ncbi:MAG: nitroreductase family deazaflavin-dependent oxidoreductase [Dehalococcoidia bacterium]